MSKEWYANGNQKSEINYLDGKKDGLCANWSPDGQVTLNGYYNGVVDDDASFFDGFTGYSGSYATLNEGECYMQSHYINGKPTYSAMWYPNGILRSEANYVDGVKVNRTVFWRDGKIRAKANYNKNGKFHGLYQQWDKY